MNSQIKYFERFQSYMATKNITYSEVVLMIKVKMSSERKQGLLWVTSVGRAETVMMGMKYNKKDKKNLFNIKICVGLFW